MFRAVDSQTKGIRGFFGREYECDWFQGVLAAVSNGGAGIAVVRGEPGIGKTSLVKRVTQAGAGQIDEVIYYRSTSQRHDPLRNFLLFLRRLIGESGAAEISEELHSSVGLVGRDFPDAVLARRSRAFSAITAQFLQRTAERLVVLIVDDLHVAAPLLVDYLEFLLDELEIAWQHRVLVVCCTTILPPRHALRPFVEQLIREREAHHLELGPLDGAGEQAMVRGEFEQAPSRAFLDLVHRSAGGNPLRVRATLETLKQRGVSQSLLSADARAWSEVSRDLPTEDPVKDWIGTLDPELRAALCQISVLGLEFTLEGAVAAVQRSAAATEKYVHRGVEQQLLETDGVRYWFANSAYQAAALELLPIAQRAPAHLAAARYLAGVDPVAAAEHYLQVGGVAGADERMSTYRAAAQLSATSTDWLQSARFYEAGLELASEAYADNFELLAALNLGAGQVHRFEADRETANQRLRDAAEFAWRCNDTETWATALVRLINIASATAAKSLHLAPEPPELGRFLEQVQDPVARSRVMQAQADAYLHAGDYERGQPFAEQALVLARQSGQPSAVAWAQWSVAFAEMVQMRLDASVSRMFETRHTAEQSGDWTVRTFVATRMAFPLLAIGELVGAEEAAQAAHDLAMQNHDHQDRALSLCVLSQSALVRGDLERAERFARESLEATEQTGYQLAHTFLAPVFLSTLLLNGRADEARESIESWPSLPQSARRLFLAQIELEAGGHPGEAPGLDPPRRPNQVTAGLYALRIDVALAAGIRDGLEAAANQIESWKGTGLEFAPSYPVSLTRVLADIRAHTGSLEQAGELYADAVARCTRAGAHLERTRALLGWARALGQGQGDTAKAAERATEAYRLARRLGLESIAKHAAKLMRPGATSPGAYRGQRCVLMMTDIVSSTEISYQRGDLAYLDTVLSHHRLVRAALARWEGVEFEEGGDSLFAWFADAGYAANAAFEIQRAVRDLGSPLLAVRIGLSFGEPLFHDGRPYGLALNVAARIASRAEPGGVVVDEAMAAELPARFEVAPGTLVELKGLGHQLVSKVSLAS